VGNSVGAGGPAADNSIWLAKPSTAASLAIFLTSELRLPHERAISATTVHVAVISLKMTR
jgi:hypothetical protein